MGVATQLAEEWPLIDAAKLQSIKNLADPDDEDDFFGDLLAIFFERVPVLLAEISLAISNKDSLKIERSAHALKGTAGNLGALSLMKLAEQLEEMGSAGDIARAPGHLADLERIYPLTKKELESKWL
jgi:two-component system sensor histidine kinase/response regulator